MAVNTTYMNEAVGGMDDMDEVLGFCQDNAGEMVDFAKILSELQRKSGLSREAFLKQCHLSASNKTVDAWFDGSMLTKREQFIKIALGTGMSLAETNRFLSRVGGYGRLYPKNIEDAAYIHVILHGGNYEDYTALLPRMTFELIHCLFRETKDTLPTEYVKEREAIPETWDEAYFAAIDSLNERYKKPIAAAMKRVRASLTAQQHRLVPTGKMTDSLRGETDMIAYVRRYWREFAAADWNLHQHITLLMEQQAHLNRRKKTVDNMHALTEEAYTEGIISEQVMSRLKKHFSELGNYGKPMPRDYIILIGLLLHQDVEGINVMLNMAHMDLLCAKRGGEAELIYILSEYGRNPEADPTRRILGIKNELTYADSVTTRKFQTIASYLGTPEDADE